MKFARLPRMPAKERLTWQIARLKLDDSGRTWFATGFRLGQVAVIPLPVRDNAESEDAWLERIEREFERAALDPSADDYLCEGTATARHKR